MTGAPSPRRYPPLVRVHRLKLDAKAGWLAVSVPTFVVADVAGIAAASVIAAGFAWAFAHYLQVRG